MIRWLITGERDWDDRAHPYGSAVAHEIIDLRERYGDELVIVHGHCPTGADEIADVVCDELGIKQEKCGRARVEAACRTAGVDPKGWSAPRAGDRVAVPFTPTPELVHGVAVSSPALAAQLRRAGVFSGQSLKGDLPDFGVQRDEHGAAVGACEADAPAYTGRAT